MNNSLPLKGIKILDLSRLLPGPYCTMILADLGAEVIKIEEPKIGDYNRLWHIGYFNGVNRNKKSITLNLKKEKAKEIFYKLCENADVIVETFRPGVVKRLGIDFETVKKFNPKIIYLSLTGFGQNTPLKSKPGHDLNYLGLSGILSFTSCKHKHLAIPSTQIADYSGAVFGVIAVLSAILRRDKIDSPQYIDIAMMDCLFSFLSMIAGKFFMDKINPEPANELLNGGYACYNIYETKDGRYLTVGALEEKFWNNLCEILGKNEWKKEIFNKEKQNEIIEELSKIFKTKTLNEWLEVFKDKDVCIEPVLNLDEALNSDYAKARKIVFKIDKISQIKNPLEISPKFDFSHNSPPSLGEHTEDILNQIGYSKEEIDKFKSEGII